MKKFVLLLFVIFTSFNLFAENNGVFYFFYADSCPHCHEAMPFIKELKAKYPKMEFRELEISKNSENQKLFGEKLVEQKIQSPGWPFFVVEGGDSVMGFKKNMSEPQIIKIVDSYYSNKKKAHEITKKEIVDTFYFFYSESCPHCHEAKPLIKELKEKYPSIKFKEMEVTQDLVNREIFKRKVKDLNITGVGVPLFIIGKDYEIGFKKNAYEKRIEKLIKKYIKKKSRLSGELDSTFYFFYSDSCPHCKQAHPFIQELKKQYSQLNFKELEVTKDKNNRVLFKKKCEELHIEARGVPTFILGNKSLVGFVRNTHDKLIKNMIESFLVEQEEGCLTPDKASIEIPIIGKINPKMVNLPSFTFIIGLLDGINPCAMWVLMFLLTLLVNAKSRKKLIMIGTVFVVSSAIVYFLFMTAWLNIFMFLGIKDTVTIILGIVAILMGLINVKEFFFFKKGVSLMIPEKAKPKLFEKMRKIMNNSNYWLSLLGTITLAFFVNLIELGCTIGLPAIYTRVLSIQKIGTFTKYLYMAFYNIYYVIPLGVIVALFVVTMGKHRFEEKHAKVLKIISGILMLSLGAVLVAKPDLLVFS